jgi:hypothetical protein
MVDSLIHSCTASFTHVYSQPILTARQWNIHTPYSVTPIPKFDQPKLPKTRTEYQMQQHSDFLLYPVQGLRGALQPHSSLGELLPLSCLTDFQRLHSSS